MKHPTSPRPKPAPSSGRRARGFSMIETLVVILLFSFGLLGLVRLQARATQGSVSAEDNNRAALLASDLASQMWTAGTVNLPAAAVDAWDLRVRNATAQGLPNGMGAVDVAANVATITVTWRPPSQMAGDTRRYVTQVLIP